MNEWFILGLTIRQEALPTLKSSQIAIFAHKTSASQKGKAKPSNKVLSHSPIAFTSLDQNPELLNTEFDNLLSSIYTATLEVRDKFESQIAG